MSVDWITTDEAAEIVGVTAHQIRHLLRICSVIIFSQVKGLDALGWLTGRRLRRMRRMKGNRVGIGDERAHSVLRISVGRFNTDGQVETAVDRIIAAVQELKY